MLTVAPPEQQHRRSTGVYGPDPPAAGIYNTDDLIGLFESVCASGQTLKCTFCRRSAAPQKHRLQDSPSDIFCVFHSKKCQVIGRSELYMYGCREAQVQQQQQCNNRLQSSSSSPHLMSSHVTTEEKNLGT